MNLLGYEACGWCPPEDAVLLLAIVLTLWKMATVKIPSFVLPPCSWESYAKCSRGAAPARVSADNAHKGGKRSTTQGITWIRLLLLVGSLPCFLSAPAAARTAVDRPWLRSCGTNSSSDGLQLHRVVMARRRSPRRHGGIRQNPYDVTRSS